MSRIFMLGAGSLAMLLSGCSMFRGECTHTLRLESQSADAALVERVHIDVGAGSLVVETNPDLTEATIDGRACSSSKQWLPDVGLTVERVDGTLRIESVFPDVMDESFGVDVTIQLPEGLHVTVDDGSGSIRMTGVAGAEIRDGSGSIQLRDIAGEVRLTDGSGSVTMEGVTGDVWIDDGSGSIEVSDVGGSVTIGEDGSGSITIRDVRGDVLVSVDGSGSINVRGVGGDFTVREGGSGRVHFSGVDGRVNLPGG